MTEPTATQWWQQILEHDAPIALGGVPVMGHQIGALLPSAGGEEVIVELTIDGVAVDVPCGSVGEIRVTIPPFNTILPRTLRMVGFSHVRRITPVKDDATAPWPEHPLMGVTIEPDDLHLDHPASLEMRIVDSEPSGVRAVRWAGLSGEPKRSLSYPGLGPGSAVLLSGGSHGFLDGQVGGDWFKAVEATPPDGSPPETLLDWAQDRAVEIIEGGGSTGSDQASELGELMEWLDRQVTVPILVRSTQDCGYSQRHLTKALGLVRTMELLGYRNLESVSRASTASREALENCWRERPCLKFNPGAIQDVIARIRSMELLGPRGAAATDTDIDTGRAFSRTASAGRVHGRSHPVQDARKRASSITSAESLKYCLQSWTRSATAA